MEQRIPITTLTGHGRGVNHLVWLPNENSIISSSEDLNLRVWNIQENGEIYILTGHESEVVHLVWSPDGTMLLTASDDRTVRVWNTTSGQQIHILPHDRSVRLAHWSPQGDQIATLDIEGVLRIWDVTSGENLIVENAHEVEGSQVRWREDTGEANILTTGHHTAQIWAYTAPNQIRSLVQLDVGNAVNDFVWSPDGTKIALILFAATEDNAIQIWGVDGTAIAANNHHEGNVEAIDWHPSDNLLVTGGNDAALVLWELTAANKLVEIARIQPHKSKVNQVLWHPTGEFIASAGADGQLIIWNPTESTVIAQTHENNINNITWHTSGDFIGTASDDTTAGIWDLNRNGSRISTLPGDNTSAKDIAWHPNGNQVAVAYESGQVIVYYTNIDALITEACSRSVRNFTQEEWQSFFDSEPYDKTCKK